MKKIKRQSTAPLHWYCCTDLGGGVLSVVLVALLILGCCRGSEKHKEATLPSPRASGVKSGFEMVMVQGGAFTMGCKDGRDTDCDSDEKPAHKVTVPNFVIGRYEITQIDWYDVMGNNPSNFRNCDQCPVENVSWDSVQDFIKKANAKYGKKYRLPTEAEWEYAARGGRLSGGFFYSGSKNLDDVAWYPSNSDNKTHPVGIKKPNELGLCDMSGNVWEWMEDAWHGDYKNAPANGSAWVGQGGYQVLRGGGWLYDSFYCRVASRSHGEPKVRDSFIGFRLCSSSLQ